MSQLKAGRSKAAATPDAERPLLSSEKESDRERGEKQKVAAHNVQIVIATFLFVDIVCVASFGYQIVTGLAPVVIPFFDDPLLAHLDKQLAFKILPGILTATFTIDVIIATVFLQKLDSVDPQWEDYCKLVKYSWLSSVFTLIILAIQRLTVVLSQRTIFVGVYGFLYMIIRCFKLRPIYKMKVLLEGMETSRDEIRYGKFWEYWSHERSSSWKKKVLRCTCIFSLVTFVAILVLFVHVDADAVPMGMLQRRHSPAMLTGCVCCETMCKTNNTWYFCVPANNCISEIAMSNTLQAADALGITGSAAFAVLLGPEAIPVGAILGAILGGTVGSGIGTGPAAYDVNKYECVNTDVPETVRAVLSCSDVEHF